MRTIAFASAVAILVAASSADAAKLVVLAVNSGIDTTSPYITDQPPNIGPGTKGFLIGIDLEDDLVDAAIGVQNIEFQNVVHQQGQKDELGDPLPTPLNIKTRSVANLQEVIDAVVSNGYRRSDTYVMDNAQQTTNVWTPVGPGFEGGDAGDTFFRITGSLGLPSLVDGPGPVQLAYVVTTGNVPISGVLARVSTGFNAMGDAQDDPRPIQLNFQTEMIEYVPEPSTFVLAGLGLLGMVVALGRRRK